MTTFLREVADHLREHHADDFEDLIVVLPGRRTGIYLKQALRDQGVLKGGWLPRFMTLSEVLAEMTGQERGDQIDLSFELYGTWRAHFEADERFSSFLQWGNTVLSDFNEIDHHLLPADQVYKNLKAYKDIDQWSFGEDESVWSEVQKQFAGFWSKLLPLYDAFHERMSTLNLFYGGAIAREASKDPIEAFDRLRAKHMVVAGLNALTPAEQKILKKLETAGCATILWDADDYYVNQRQLEAGLFIRKAGDLGNTSALATHFLKAGKKIHFTGCSSTISQMQYVGQQLEQSSADDALQTAVVLPDNSVLPALLPVIPEHFDSINVTMGKPIATTPLKSLFHHFFRLFDLRGDRLRHTEFMQLLRHPMSGGVATPAGVVFRQVQRQIVIRNSVFLSEETLLAMLNDERPVPGPSGATEEDMQLAKQQIVKSFQLLYRSLRTRKTMDVLQALEHFMNLVEPSTSEKELHQAWKQSSGLVHRLQRMHERYPVMETPRDTEQIMSKLLHRLQIDLIGEPLNGLQVMGLLESRSLDFKKVFILSSNEGIVPKQSFADSFLPAVIRKHHELPSKHERDAIFAYYFYRLIQRAEEVHLIYSAGESSHKTGEKSRYLQQLETCELLENAGVERIHRQVLCEVPSEQPVIPAITITKWAVERFNQLKERGLSPSALNKWIECPNNFYHRYVLGLREQDAVEEEIESSTLGNIVHEAVDQGLKPYTKKVLTEENVRELLDSLQDFINAAFVKYYNRELTATGVNYLSKSVALKFAEKILQNDLRTLKLSTIQIERLEEKLKAEVGGAGNVIGYADRVDRIDGHLRVMDYKTGRVTPGDLEIKGDWQERLESGKMSKALQTMVYAWMCRQLFDEEVVAGILSTRSHSAGFMPVMINKETLTMDAEFTEEFGNWLNELLQSIGKEGDELTHNHDALYCEYCVTLEGAE